MKVPSLILALACSAAAALAQDAPGAPAPAGTERRAELERARRNGAQAREALRRSHRVLRAYLERRDAVTGLLPRNGRDPSWQVKDSAADLYPFLVLAAWFTDRPAFENEMHEILRAEIQHSTRVGRLPDDVRAGGGFLHPEVAMDRLIFGASEYAKDGLLPVTEWLGRSAWQARLTGIADDVIAHAPHRSAFGPVPSMSAEVNGEMLQVLTRLAFATGEERYARQALAIARFYFEEVLPKSNGLPPHLWDAAAGKPAADFFQFADHGNEIAGGLSEFVLFLDRRGHPLREPMAENLSRLIHLLLDVGLNEDGVWIMKVSCSGREVLDARHAHCWGYLFNSVHTAWLVTGEDRFLEAVKRALRSVTDKPSYLDDPEGSGRNYGSNAYSDAIESALVLLNRLPDERQFAVLDECVARFLGRQRADGIVEDWYGDGNYVRTALMYALMKSQGARVEEWRPDLGLGAVRDGPGVVLTLEAERPWSGKLCFDVPRHRLHFNLPVNYPRLNEFPEWFVVEPDALYEVNLGGVARICTGGQLAAGLPVRVEGEAPLTVRIAPLPGPPYGPAAAGGP